MDKKTNRVQGWSRYAAVASTGRFCAFLIAFVLMMFPSLLEAGTITLQWDPNSDAVAGYLVFFGTQSGQYAGSVDVGTATKAFMSIADPSATYYFAVAAYSSSGLRSSLSPEVSWAATAPVLMNPGSQTSTAGQSVTLTLTATDPNGLGLTYQASGLPTGLAIANATGIISGIAATAGAYNVTASATNTVGASATQLFTWTVLTQPSSPVVQTGDTTPPRILITSPTTGGSYTTNTPAISLSGSASDNVGVVSVSWASDRGGRGDATAEGSSWTAARIPLKNGPNVLTVTATDGAGNKASATLTVVSKSAGKK